MNDLTKFFDDDLARQVVMRIADSEFANLGDYLNDLVRRDLEKLDEETAWLREQIDLGRATGYIDKAPREVIEDVIAERRARR